MCKEEATCCSRRPKWHEQLRAKIRAFAEEEVKPIAFSLDQANEFPAEAVKKLGSWA